MAKWATENAIREYDRDREIERKIKAAKNMRRALQTLWDVDEMCWITDSSGIYTCGQCSSSKEYKKNIVNIIHGEGCIQGIIYKAMMDWDNS